MTSMTTATRNHSDFITPLSSRTYFSANSDQRPSSASASASVSASRQQSTSSPTYLIRGVPIRVDYGAKPKAGRRRSNTLPTTPVTAVDRFQRAHGFITASPGTPPVNFNANYNRPRSSTYTMGQSRATTASPKGILVREPLQRQNSQDKTVQFQEPVVEKNTAGKYPDEKYPSTENLTLINGYNRVPMTDDNSSFKPTNGSIYSKMEIEEAPLPNFEKNPPNLNIENPLHPIEQRKLERLAAQPPIVDPSPLPKSLRQFEESLQRELKYDEILHAKPEMTYSDVGVRFQDSPFTPGHVSPPPMTEEEKQRGEKRYRFAYPKPEVPPHETSLDQYLQDQQAEKARDTETKVVMHNILHRWQELAAHQDDEFFE